MKLKIPSWNVRGANNLDKRKVMKAFIKSQRVDVVCVKIPKLRIWIIVLFAALGLADLWIGGLRMQKELQGGFWFFWTRSLELVDLEVGLFSVFCRFRNVEDGFL